MVKLSTDQIHYSRTSNLEYTFEFNPTNAVLLEVDVPKCLFFDHILRPRKA